MIGRESIGRKCDTFLEQRAESDCLRNSLLGNKVKKVIWKNCYQSENSKI